MDRVAQFIGNHREKNWTWLLSADGRDLHEQGNEEKFKHMLEGIALGSDLKSRAQLRDP